MPPPPAADAPRWQLSLPFRARGRDGRVRVTVVRNDAPEALGCAPVAEGFPACSASVDFDGRGYEAMFGWVQLVGTATAPAEPLTFEVDPLEVFAELDIPLAFYGPAPAMFDGPSRRDRHQRLVWLAHAFLCASVSHPMARDLTAVTGFSWGFVLEPSALTITPPARLEPSAWPAHLDLLRGTYPGWTFLP